MENAYLDIEIHLVIDQLGWPTGRIVQLTPIPRVVTWDTAQSRSSPIQPRICPQYLPHTTHPLPDNSCGQYNRHCSLFKYTTLPTINPTPSFPLCAAIVPSWPVACCVNVCGPLFGFAHVYIICCTIAIRYIIQYASCCCVWSPLSVSGLAIGNLAIGIACNLQIFRQGEIFNVCICLPARQRTDIIYDEAQMLRRCWCKLPAKLWRLVGCTMIVAVTRPY